MALQQAPKFGQLYSESASKANKVRAIFSIFYSAEEVLKQFSSEEVLKQFSPEKRLEGLSLEEIEAYLKRSAKNKKG